MIELMPENLSVSKVKLSISETDLIGMKFDFGLPELILLAISKMYLY